MGSDARRKAEEALRYDHDHANSPEVRRRLRGAVEVLLAAEPEARPTAWAVARLSRALHDESDWHRAEIGNEPCGDMVHRERIGIIQRALLDVVVPASAPSPARDEVREAAERLRAAIAKHKTGCNCDACDSGEDLLAALDARPGGERGE